MTHRTIIVPEGVGYSTIIVSYYAPGQWTRVETLVTYFSEGDARRASKGSVVRDKLRELNCE